jgi:hypothetical protein
VCELVLPGSAFQTEILQGEGSRVERDGKTEVNRLQRSLLVIIQQQEVSCIMGISFVLLWKLGVSRSR